MLDEGPAIIFQEPVKGFWLAPDHPDPVRAVFQVVVTLPPKMADIDFLHSYTPSKHRNPAVWSNSMNAEIWEDLGVSSSERKLLF